MEKTNKHTVRGSFTKKLLLFFIAVAIVLTTLTVILAFRDEPDYNALNVMATVTATWFGGTTVFTGFYIWKAKNENRHKYAQAWLNDIGEKYGWEAAARFAEIDLKGD